MAEQAERSETTQRACYVSGNVSINGSESPAVAFESNVYLKHTAVT